MVGTPSGKQAMPSPKIYRLPLRGVQAASNEALARSAASRAPRRREDAIAVLVDDHARIAELFARFDRLESNGPRKAALVERICDEIEVHSRIEEEIFYPSVRAAIEDDEAMDEAAVEHETARSMVEQLRALRPGDFRYDAKVRVLGEYIRHHVDQEQRYVFPKARRIHMDLVALGRALRARKRQLRGSSQHRRAFAMAAYPGGLRP
jgi:hypothetical protein